MTSTVQNLRLLNIKQTQKHPFHVLTDSKLPIFMATFAGLLALTFISKLHDIDYAASFGFSLIASQVLDPFYSAGGLNYLSVNAIILALLTLISLTMGSWSYNLLKESV